MRKFRYGMMAPFAAVFAVAIGFPLVYAVYLSFVDKKLTSQRPPQFTGIDNYTKAFHGKFIGSLGVTATYVVIAVVAELVLALLIALALQRQRWMKDLTRSVLLIPMFITPIAVALVFRFLLNSQLGRDTQRTAQDRHRPRLLRLRLGTVHPGRHRRLAVDTISRSCSWWPVWSRMPKQPLEAAKVDGASGLYTLFRVTLPLLSPVLTVAVMLARPRCAESLRVRLRHHARRAGHRDGDASST